MKTTKAKTKIEIPQGSSIIPGLTNLQTYNLVNTLDSMYCGHVARIYITADGYFFSPGNDLHEMVDLDPKLPTEAALLKAGRKQKRILLPGTYIARKRILHEYTREEILGKRKEIEATNAAGQKLMTETLGK